MVNGVWFRLDEALPPLGRKMSENECNCSVTVAIVLKSGDICKGFRYYESGPSCWAILDGKDTELSDDDIVGWTFLPPFGPEEF